MTRYRNVYSGEALLCTCGLHLLALVFVDQVFQLVLIFLVIMPKEIGLHCQVWLFGFQEGIEVEIVQHIELASSSVSTVCFEAGDNLSLLVVGLI